MKDLNIIVKQSVLIISIIINGLPAFTQYNTNLGFKAGESMTSGESNVMIGEKSGQLNNGSGNIFIGNAAGMNEVGSNKLIISNDSSLATIYGDLDLRRIAIGTDDFPTDSSFRLVVEGKIMAREFKATQALVWPDFVFKDNYKLLSIDSLSQFIEINGHLPMVPTANQVENEGIELGAMNAVLLRKIEELTLYIIEIHETLKKQAALINDLDLLKKEHLKESKERN